MDVIGPALPTGELGLSFDQKLKTEALIDYVATTPQNINYNILREIIKATVLNKNHPYFDYYQEKMSQTEESHQSEPNPGGGGSISK